MDGGIYQFIYQGYTDVVRTFAGDAANNIIAAMIPILQGMVLLYVLVLGKNLAYGELSSGEMVTRIVRALVISALLVPATFSQYVTTPFTETIPNLISQAVSGRDAAVGAARFDDLNNQIANMAAQVRAQISLVDVGNLVACWVVEIVALVLITMCFVVWAAANLTVYFVVPLLAFLAPLYLFDGTRGFTERWVGKMVALFMIQALALMVAAAVVAEDGAYLKKYGTMVAAAPTNQGFAINGGDMQFTAFGDAAVGNPNFGAGPAPAKTANVAAGVQLILNFGLVALVGAFLLSCTTVIAFAIGASSGFSASPVVRAVSQGVSKAVNAAKGAAKRADA